MQAGEVGGVYQIPPYHSTNRLSVSLCSCSVVLHLGGLECIQFFDYAVHIPLGPELKCFVHRIVTNFGRIHIFSLYSHRQQRKVP